MYKFFIFTLGTVCAVCTSKSELDHSSVSPDEDKHIEQIKLLYSSAFSSTLLSSILLLLSCSESEILRFSNILFPVTSYFERISRDLDIS